MSNQVNGNNEITTTTKKPKKKALIWIIIAAVVVVAAVVVIILVTDHNAKVNSYEEAVRLMNSKNYSEAEEIFISLGNYEDSENLAAICDEQGKKKMAYENARSYFNSLEFEKAKELFEEAGDYGDAEEMANECVLRMEVLSVFEDAKKQADKGNYQKAFEILDGIDPEYSDMEIESGTTIEGYKNEYETKAKYSELVKAYEKADYETAKELFDYIDTERGWEWLEGDDREKKNMIYYQLFYYLPAMELYNEGKYESAYEAFEKAEDYKKYDAIIDIEDDVTEMKESCVQPTPSTGLLYQSPSYSSYATSLTIENDGSNCVTKIYSSNGDLACIMFARPYENVTVNLPAGTYYMTQGYGDTWYGVNELFGKYGNYLKCTFGGSSEFFTLEYGGIYSISSDNDGGTTVGGRSIPVDEV